MADEGGEKTEMPTAKKLRDARQKGQVCTSKDVVSTALLVVLMYLTAMLAAMLMDDIEQLITFIGRALSSQNVDGAVRQAGHLRMRCRSGGRDRKPVPGRLPLHV